MSNKSEEKNLDLAIAIHANFFKFALAIVNIRQINHSMDDAYIDFLKHLKIAIECADVEELTYLLHEDLHDRKKLVESLMVFPFNRELAKLLWSFLKQPKFDVDELSLENRTHAPLTLATALEQTEVIQLLFKIPSLDVNIAHLPQVVFFAENNTSLQIACQNKNFEVIKIVFRTTTKRKQSSIFFSTSVERKVGFTFHTCKLKLNVLRMQNLATFLEY